MGKGDKKTKKGKIHKGTFGVLRPKGKSESRHISLRNECVYCGIPLLNKKESSIIEGDSKKYPNNGKTKDHVPQKCLFEGYPSNYKLNRFTVPACHKCNFKFSQVEHELRDLIGIANQNNDLQATITEDSVSSILMQPSGLSRIVKDAEGQVRGVEFNLDTLLPSHVKNFKGVFYKTYDKRLPDSFTINVIDKKLNSNFESLAIRFLEINSQWNISGHEDIFKYKIVMIKSDKKGALTKGININESIAVLCHLVYHKSYNMLVLANRKNLVKKRIS